jgi:hypothetical protein
MPALSEAGPVLTAILADKLLGQDLSGGFVANPLLEVLAICANIVHCPVDTGRGPGRVFITDPFIRVVAGGGYR